MTRKFKLFSSKRGIVVMLGLLLLMLIVPAILFFVVRAKADLFDQSLGERDFAVLAAASTSQAALTYLDQSAVYAAHDAYVDFLEQGSSTSLGSCGSYRGSSVVFFEGADCFPSQERVHEAYASLLNAHLDLYLQNYPFVYFPRHNYVVTLDGTTLQGLAQNPLVLPVISSRDVQLSFSGTTPVSLLNTDSQEAIPESSKESSARSPVSVSESIVKPSCATPASLLLGKPLEEQFALAAKYYGANEDAVRSSLVSFDFLGTPVVVHKTLVPTLTCVVSSLQNCPEAKNYVFSSLTGFTWNGAHGEGSDSFHQFGIALDINPNSNPTCGVYDPNHRCLSSDARVTDLPTCVIDAFKHAGFSWGGDDTTHPKPMHFVYMGAPLGVLAEDAALISTNPSSQQASIPSSSSVKSCEQPLVTIIGNSHMVGLKQYLKKTGVQNFYLMEDRDQKTVDIQYCKVCDPFSYVGRTLADMNTRITQAISEMNARSSTIAIVYEGPNSYWLSKKQQKTYLKSIVTALHNAGKTVYLAEMPMGVVGSDPTLTKAKVLQYNAVIADSDVGADGIIHTQNVPWKSGNLHGYTSGTFPYFLSHFDSATRVSQVSCASS